MTWLAETAPGATPLDQVFGLLPGAYERFRELYGGLWQAGGVSPGILELCRIRVGTILSCEGETAVRYGAPNAEGLSEEKVARLAGWPDDPVFSAGERAALAFCEQYVLDPHGLLDTHFEALRASLDEAEVATLVLAVAMFDALTRFRLALEVEPAADRSRRPLTVAGPGSRPASLP